MIIKATFSILVLTFLSLPSLAQTELIQNIEEYHQNKRLTNWELQYTNYSRFVGQPKRIKRKFDSRISKEGIKIHMNSSNETVLTISRIGNSIQLKTPIRTKLKRNEILKVSFDFKYNHENCLNSFWFSHETQVNKKEGRARARNIIFKAPESMKDTVQENIWYHIEFYYSAPNIKKTEDFFVLNYLNPFRNQESEIQLKNLSVQKFNLAKTTNLVPNPSFEYYHNIPSERGQFGYGIFSEWNDFGQEFDLILNESTGVDIYINQVTDISHLSLMASDYFKFYSDSIKMYDGHFAAVLSNDYKNSGNELQDLNYLQVKLKEELKEGKTYVLRFAYMLCPNATTACNAFGIKFSNERYNPYTEVDFSNKAKPLPVADIQVFKEPWTNDSTWTVFETEYIATGEEQYLVFGIFENKPLKIIQIPWNKGRWTSDYLIDSVSLIEK